MKFRNVISSAILIASILFFSTASSSQTMSKELLFRVNVPFDFVAAGVNLPPGHYSVYHVMTPKVILLESDNERDRAFVQVGVSSSEQRQHPTALVFNNYGGRYFLASVTTKNDHQVHICLKSKEEEILIVQRKASEKQVVTVGY